MQNGSTSDRLARMYSQAKGSREEVEKFGSEAEKTAILAKMRSLKQEIELPLQLAMEKVKEAEGKMREEELFSPGKERVTCVILKGDRTWFSYDANYMSKDAIPINIYRKDLPCPVILTEDFLKLIERIKTDIDEGKMDDRLHMTANQLIFDEVVKFIKENYPEPPDRQSYIKELIARERANLDKPSKRGKPKRPRKKKKSSGSEDKTVGVKYVPEELERGSPEWVPVGGSYYVPADKRADQKDP